MNTLETAEKVRNSPRRAFKRSLKQHLQLNQRMKGGRQCKQERSLLCTLKMEISLTERQFLLCSQNNQLKTILMPRRLMGGVVAYLVSYNHVLGWHIHIHKSEVFRSMHLVSCTWTQMRYRIVSLRQVPWCHRTVRIHYLTSTPYVRFLSLLALCIDEIKALLHVCILPFQSSTLLCVAVLSVILLHESTGFCILFPWGWMVISIISGGGDYDTNAVNMLA
jgi:hypothetical protein